MIIDKLPTSDLGGVQSRHPHLPLSIIELWLRNCLMAGNRPSLVTLRDYPTASKAGGAFDWHSCEEGAHFWYDVLTHRDIRNTSAVILKNAIYVDFKRFD